MFLNDHGIQWRTLLDLKRAQLHGGEGLMRRQQDRFEALLSHARARSRFYQRHYAGLSSSDLALGDLPAVTKPRLMAAFDDWVTDPIITRAGLEAFIAQPNQIGVPYLDRYFVCTSSGTTGHPGLFVHDSRAVGVYQAINTARITPAWFDAGQLMRIARGGFRWAAVLGTQSHYVGASWLALEQRRGGWRSRGIQVFSVQQKLEALVAELQAFDPVLLTGYPSAIDLLAQEQLAGRLKLKLVTVELSGESLPQEAHARIAAAFGCPVRDLYAASECPSIAFSCDHGWLHVNSDWVVLEPVEEDLGPTPVGRFSHTVLLTNLANWIQPLIRYDLGDSVMVSPDRCACGCPLPAIRVAGRQDDILQLAGANGSVVKVPPLAIGAVIEESPGVKLGQILQVGPSTIHLRLELIDGVDAGQVWRDAIARLEAYLSTQRLDNVTVVRSGEPPKRSAPFGKFRQVIAGRAMNDGSAPTPGA